MHAEAFDCVDALPAQARTLLGAGGFCSTEAWYRLVCDHALPPGARPEFLLCSGAPGAALLPLANSGRQLGSLTTPYTSRFAPIGTAGMDRDAWLAAGEAAGLRLRRAGCVRLDAIDAEDPCLPGFADGLRAAGLLVRLFDHFGNWHEPVAGLSWGAYLAARPGQLRETLRRKARTSSLRFEVAEGPGAEAGAAAYALVYARSWKQPEPFPEFPAALIRTAAATGALRLGLCWKDDRPVAAQIWIIHGRQASVHKLAHDEADRADSPGTLLTARVLQPLLDGGEVDEIDFGRGDDAYKRSWATRRRQRVGLLAINPYRTEGLAALGREGAGALRRRLRGFGFSEGRVRRGRA